MSCLVVIAYLLGQSKTEHRKVAGPMRWVNLILAALICTFVLCCQFFIFQSSPKGLIMCSYQSCMSLLGPLIFEIYASSFLKTIQQTHDFVPVTELADAYENLLITYKMLKKGSQYFLLILFCTMGAKGIASIFLLVSSFYPLWVRLWMGSDALLSLYICYIVCTTCQICYDTLRDEKWFIR